MLLLRFAFVAVILLGLAAPHALAQAHRPDIQPAHDHLAALDRGLRDQGSHGLYARRVGVIEPGRSQLHTLYLYAGQTYQLHGAAEDGTPLVLRLYDAGGMHLEAVEPPPGIARAPGLLRVRPLRSGVYRLDVRTPAGEPHPLAYSVGLSHE